MKYYFKHIHRQLKTEIKKTLLKGWFQFAIGISLMLVKSYLPFIKSQIWHMNLLLIFFEPVKCFLLWSGLEDLVYNPKDCKKELNFYPKSFGLKIEFLTLKNNSLS